MTATAASSSFGESLAKNCLHLYDSFFNSRDPKIRWIGHGVKVLGLYYSSLTPLFFFGRAFLGYLYPVASLKSIDPKVVLIDQECLAILQKIQSERRFSLEEIQNLLPESLKKYLNSSETKEVEKIRNFVSNILTVHSKLKMFCTQFNIQEPIDFCIANQTRLFPWIPGFSHPFISWSSSDLKGRDISEQALLYQIGQILNRDHAWKDMIGFSLFSILHYLNYGWFSNSSWLVNEVFSCYAAIAVSNWQESRSEKIAYNFATGIQKNCLRRVKFNSK